jgi:hypothetical protein
MPRIVAVFVAALSLAICFDRPARGQAAPLGGGSTKLTPKQNAAASGEQKHALERPLPELRLSGSALSDVIDFLADTTGANFAVDWKALDAAKVAKDTPITLRLNSVSLRKALQLILNQAGGAGVLTYYVDEGVIQITSTEQADKEMITRLYGIQDLLFEAQDYTNAPQLDLTSSNTSGGGRGGGGGSQQNIFSGGSNTNQTNTVKTRDARAQEIIKLITDTVRPEIWAVNGGTATISYIRGNLVVTAPRSVHEQLSSQ